VHAFESFDRGAKCSTVWLIEEDAGLPFFYGLDRAAAAISDYWTTGSVRFERRLFQSQFALEDQKEGMAAFVEKRKPDFKHR